MDAPLIANAIRAHWRIENNLHWSLDVIFREDQSRIRKASHAVDSYQTLTLAIEHGMIRDVAPEIIYYN